MNAAFVLVMTAALLDPGPAAPWRSREEAQQRARDMARDLISGILDIQLKQLRENRLEKLPVYAEITSMRAHIDSLVETEMREVVEMLVEIQGQSPVRQRQVFQEMREKIRQIVVRLSVERHTLLGRLKMAELAAQIERLMALQRTTLGATENLTAIQEMAALAAVHDQRDAKALFVQLLETLDDISRWGGGVGAAAADGLRTLKASRVGEEVDKAVAALEGARFAPAMTSQKAVLQGLSVLLERVEQARGLIQAERETALRQVRDLVRRQGEIREKTRQMPLAAPSAENLVQQQSAVHKELDKLTDRLGRTPAWAPLLERAKTSAFEATAELFDARPQRAVLHQDKVVEGLDALAGRLQSSQFTLRPAAAETPEQDSPDRSRAAQVQRDKASAARTQTVSAGSDSDGLPAGARGSSGSGPGDGRADFSGEPWFARLPPEVRKAIEAKSRRPAPRGYEERLQRYFRHVE